MKCRKWCRGMVRNKGDVSILARRCRASIIVACAGRLQRLQLSNDIVIALWLLTRRVSLTHLETLHAENKLNFL